MARWRAPPSTPELFPHRRVYFIRAIRFPAQTAQGSAGTHADARPRPGARECVCEWQWSDPCAPTAAFNPLIVQEPAAVGAGLGSIVALRRRSPSLHRIR